MRREKIAVIGGGVAGIAAAYALMDRHDVTIFEADLRLGGHAQSVEIIERGTGAVAAFYVDTAFLIFNSGSYPLFLHFLDELDLTKTVQTADMSMSFDDAPTGLQYAVNAGWNAVFAQRRNFMSPSFWRLLREIRSFRKVNSISEALGNRLDLSLSEYASTTGRSRKFSENFLYPLGASVWSVPTGAMFDFPAEMFFRFFLNHRMLKNEAGSRWLTMRGGSIQYIREFQRRFTGQVLLNTQVSQIKRFSDGVQIVAKDARGGRFDRVILATHADDALKLLEAPTETESRLLGTWNYQKNSTVLHTDESWMPRNRRAWASWNIRCEERGNVNRRFFVTYHLNRIQDIPTEVNYFITLEDEGRIDAAKIIRRFNYKHPIFTTETEKVRADLATLNGQRSYFCGSYFGNGFHEDAIYSAQQAVSCLAEEH